MQHIVSDDSFAHIECEGCWCNPTVVCVEGEEHCVHNSNYTNDEYYDDRERSEEIGSTLCTRRRVA